MSALGQDEIDKLLYTAFLRSAWDDAPEHARMLANLRGQVSQQLDRHPDLLERFEQACAEGEQAHKLAAQLKRRLRQEGDTPGTRAWLQQTKGKVSARVGRHLDVTHAKALGRSTALRQRLANEGRSETSRVSAIRLGRGEHHPNSLRHLAPSHHWQVLIDETGTSFDERARSMTLDDVALGRLVALAIPAGIRLPALSGFHATSVDPASVDAVVQDLLQSPVGIFGFTVHDPAIQATSWVSHIIWLVRWTLAQLPVEPGAATQVDVLIEQNKGYDRQHDLRALAEMLGGELLRLSPQRYAGLSLRMGFMSKAQPRNGYVDAIAFTWGSPTAVSRDRLKKTAWLGHCLLRPDDQALERLYLALHGGRELPAPQWYALCAAAAEAVDGVLDDALAELGASLGKRPDYWQRCLAEVRRRMQTRDFRLHELAQALAWLQRWGPQGSMLPAAQQLMLETAGLAVDNHRGRVDEQRIGHCIDLAQRLHDESPAEACEAMLRIAVACTNVFEFDLMRATIEAWLAKPVAIPGLLNHGKLHSTLGQLDAFRGNGTAAVEHFERALAAFAQLSDPAQVARETAHTNTYRLIAMQDCSGVPAQSLLAELGVHFHTLTGESAPAAISRALAHSGQSLRYAHHLWLRALVTHAAALGEARAAYLQQRDAWQDGDDYPWPLVHAYRAWLLHDAGQPAEAAVLLSTAVRQCADPDNGPTLRWVGAVLHTLAAALGIDLEPDATAESAATLRQLLPAAPHAALADFIEHAGSGEYRGQGGEDGIRHALCRCLPFNFH